MDTSSKICSCGARFELQVQLVVHCKQTTHAPLVLVSNVPRVSKVAPAAQNPRRSWRQSLAAGMLIVSLAGLTAGLNLTVQKVTSWQGTANVLVLP